MTRVPRVRHNQPMITRALRRLPRTPGDGGGRIDLLAVAIGAVITVTLGIEGVRMLAASAGLLPGIGWVITTVGALLCPRRPLLGVAIASFGGVLAALGEWGPLVEWSVTVFLVFQVTLHWGKPVLSSSIVLVPTIAATVLSRDLGDVTTSALATVVSLAAGAGIGAGLRTQRLYQRSLEQRARDALVTRDLEITHRVAEERLRIARDLHDVVGHEVAVVSMHLGVIEMTVPEPSEDTAKALLGARHGIRNVLTETQRMLVLLRADRDEHSTAPVPDLSHIPALLESYRSLSMDVRAHIDTDEATVDKAVQLTVYRVLQEAMTNASKYGRGTVNVSCVSASGEIVVEVRNGHRVEPVPQGTGLGLIGMNERVTALGGTLHITSTGREHRIAVRLPLTKGSTS